MCDLQRFIKDLTDAILNFKLDLCCFVFSVRVGILLCGYFNIISNMICLIAVSTGVFLPLMMNAQQSFMEGEYIISTCAFAYSADLCLAVHLLCGVYRKDLVLLRYYTYCGMAMLASTLLVYSMVIGVLTVLNTCMLVISLSYQAYIILLVRSMMVELKQEQERFEYFYQNYPVYIKHDIEAPGDYPLEAYEKHSPSSRRNSEIIPAALNARPKSTENEQVKDTIELKTIEAKGTKPQKKKIKDTEPQKKEIKHIEPKRNEVKEKHNEVTTDTKSRKPVEDQPTTSKTVTDDKSKTEAVPETSKPKAMRYPYKFIAIKVPKEESIKEENEERETDKVEVKEEIKEVAKKEEIKEVVKEEESKEVVKETKKQKRSIFGRKKSKTDDGKTKNVDKKNESYQ